MIRIATNPSPFEQVEAHLVETMFYDKWAPFRESLVSKLQHTFLPRWEDVRDDPEPDLRKLLMQKKKRKKTPTLESDEARNALGFRPLMAESSTNYERGWGPHAMCKQAPGYNVSIKVWYIAWLKKVRKKKVTRREMKKLQ